MSEENFMLNIKALKKLSTNPDNNHYGLDRMRLIRQKPEVGYPALFLSNYFGEEWFRTSEVVEILEENNVCTLKTRNSVYQFEYKEDQ